MERRFGVALDPDRQIIPTLGSKEAIFSFAQVVLDLPAGRDTVVVTEPGYPVPDRGAQFAGARVVALPLLEANGFLPDLAAVPAETWARTALLWLNYPNNPTGAVAPLSFLEQAAALARQHGFVLASDEAYTELWFDAPPPSALQLADLSGVVAFNTLSKRSSMTGFRSGFIAGDAELVAALKPVPTERRDGAAGVRPARVDRRLVGRAARRDRPCVLRAEARAVPGAVCPSRPAQRRWRLDDVPLDRRPGGETSEQHAERLLDHGVVVAPGSFLGPSGEGYVRYALVPTFEECERAVALLDDALVTRRAR